MASLDPMFPMATCEASDGSARLLPDGGRHGLQDLVARERRCRGHRVHPGAGEDSGNRRDFVARDGTPCLPILGPSVGGSWIADLMCAMG